MAPVSPPPWRSSRDEPILRRGEGVSCKLLASWIAWQTGGAAPEGRASCPDAAWPAAPPEGRPFLFPLVLGWSTAQERLAWRAYLEADDLDYMEGFSQFGRAYGGSHGRHVRIAIFCTQSERWVGLPAQDVDRATRHVWACAVVRDAASSSGGRSFWHYFFYDNEAQSVADASSALLPHPSPSPPHAHVRGQPVPYRLGNSLFGPGPGAGEQRTADSTAAQPAVLGADPSTGHTHPLGTTRQHDFYKSQATAQQGSTVRYPRVMRPGSNGLWIGSPGNLGQSQCCRSTLAWVARIMAAGDAPYVDGDQRFVGFHHMRTVKGVDGGD